MREDCASSVVTPAAFQARHHGLLPAAWHSRHSGAGCTFSCGVYVFGNLDIELLLMRMPGSEDYGQVAEDEDRETEDDLDEEDEEYDSGGSGVAMTPPGVCL